MRLVCLPGAGSAPSMFHPWSALLPSDVEVCAVNVPGRGARLREAPITRMTLLADALADALRREAPLPTVLFGHSLGGLVAYEVADRLRDSPETRPAALVVAAHKAPRLGNAGPGRHLLPARALVRMLDDLGGTPADALADPTIRRMVLSAVRADFELDHTYRFHERPPLEIPITAFGGHADPLVSVGQLVEWRGHSTAEFRLRMFPGGHFFHNDPGGAAMFSALGNLLLGHIDPLPGVRSTRPAKEIPDVRGRR